MLSVVESKKCFFRFLNGLTASLVGVFGVSLTALADYQLNMSPGVTPVSKSIFDLHNTIMWICVAIGIAVYGVMFYAIIRHRKSRGVKPAQFHDSTIVEIVWTIIPFVILVAMAIPSTKVLVDMYDHEEPELNIKVTGYQWKWKYDYLEDEFGFFSELHQDSRNAIDGSSPKGEHYLLDVDNPVVIPVKTKVRFLVTSKDVIHSWFVPALGVKKDAIPGFINETWTYVEEPGVYRGQCTELCGKDHGFMPVVVVAKAEDDYQTWLQKTKTELSKAVDMSDRDFDWLMKTGEAIYLSKCAVCHQPGGQGLGPFPALKGSAVATTGPIAEHSALILNGRNAMPAFAEQLNDVEIAAVVTYERNAWGNDTGDIVQPNDVNALR